MTRKFHVAEGSLTDGSSLLLVNAANTNVNLGSGVSGAIRRACGVGYQEHLHQALEARFGGPMEPGAVLVTDAGSHPTARYVAHVAVMDYRQGFTVQSFPTPALLERCYANLWQAIETITAEPFVSVAAVALGAGTGNIALRESVEIGCGTLAAHLAQVAPSRIDDVTFYGYDLVEYRVVREVVAAHFPIEP